MNHSRSSNSTMMLLVGTGVVCIIVMTTILVVKKVMEAELDATTGTVGKAVPSSRQNYATIAELARVLKGLDRAAVKAKLGKPNSGQSRDGCRSEAWAYVNSMTNGWRVADPVSNLGSPWIYVIFYDGKVVEVSDLDVCWDTALDEARPSVP